MTFPDDGRDDPGQDAPQGSDVPLDEDAAWRAIVENYGARAELGVAEPLPAASTDPAPAVEPAEPVEEPVGTSPFDTSFLDAQRAEQERAAAAWHDEGHFVPPEPPPVPATTPARRLAWIGLFGAPVLMLVAVIFPLTYPTWVSMGLVAAFVGGFVFLVATMERDDGDGFGGDDGAVV
ncbi:MAG: hypothetical protein ABIQ59_11625 [Nocardioidaceae bacterium]